MFSGDSINLLVLTPIGQCLLVWTKCWVWPLTHFWPSLSLSSKSLLELALLTVSECGFLAHVLCTLRSDVTLKKLLYVLVGTFLCCTAGMLRLSVWFCLLFMSSSHVPTLTVWVFSLAILKASHFLQTCRPGASFPPLHTCVGVCRWIICIPCNGGKVLGFAAQ